MRKTDYHKILLTMSVIAFSMLSALAEIVFTKETIIPRNGDIITRQLRSYVNPGDSGINKVWNFSQTDLIDGNSQIEYSLLGDSCINTRQQSSIYRFAFDNDNLYNCGFENRLSIINDSIPAIEMTWPLSYGKKVEKDFYFKGRYSSEKNIEEIGESSICADALGRLILPDGDTIDNALRICNKRISDVFIYSSDNSVRKSNKHKFVSHKWYVKGYRYPFAETISDSYYSDSVMISCRKISYLIPRTEQEYVTRNDIANIQLRNETTYGSCNNTEYYNLNDSDITTDSNSKDSALENIVLNVSNGMLYVSYQMIGTCNEMEMILSDTQGRVYSYIPKHNIKYGFNNIEINCSNLPSGNYLLTFLYNSYNDVNRFSIK